jgi:DNA-binding CsgD family transcriptional regulator
MRLLAENLTSREIAERLFISARTVENHRLRISQKLELSGHHKLLQFALEHKDEV